MTMGLSIARLIVLVTGVLIALVGLWIIALPGGPGSVIGLYTVVIGLAFVVAAVIERVRYRADAVDRAGPPDRSGRRRTPGRTTRRPLPTDRRDLRGPHLRVPDAGLARPRFG